MKKKCILVYISRVILLNSHYSMEGVTCNWCLKLFGTTGNLNRHIRSVHLKEKMDCNLCGARFSQQANLIRHKQTIHGIFKQDFSNIGLKKRYQDEDDSGSISESLMSENASHCSEQSDLNEADQASEGNNSDSSSSTATKDSSGESDASDEEEHDSDDEHSSCQELGKMKIRLMTSMLHIMKDI